MEQLDAAFEAVRTGMIESARMNAICFAAVMALIEDHPRREQILQSMREASAAPEAILATMRATTAR